LLGFWIGKGRQGSTAASGGSAFLFCSAALLFLGKQADGGARGARVVVGSDARPLLHAGPLVTIRPSVVRIANTKARVLSKQHISLLLPPSIYPKPFVLDSKTKEKK
jgi:hypothetical protein